MAVFVASSSTRRVVSASGRVSEKSAQSAVASRRAPVSSLISGCSCRLIPMNVARIFISHSRLAEGVFEQDSPKSSIDIFKPAQRGIDESGLAQYEAPHCAHGMQASKFL